MPSQVSEVCSLRSPSASTAAAAAARFAWLTGPVALLVIQLARFVHLARLPESALVQYVPDDAFYYLQLARNFARLHRWTFDGVAPATGFHLLWGYLLAALYAVAPNLSFHAIFDLLFLLAAALIVLSCALITRLVRSRFGTWSVVGVTTVFLSFYSLQVPNELMEAPLAITCAAAVLSLCSVRKPSRKTLIIAFPFGVLGMLSRSDFGLLPGVLFVAALAFRTRAARTAGVALLGSVLGLGLIFTHSTIVAGHRLQGSTQVKRHWSQVNHDSLADTAIFAARPLHTDPNAMWQPDRALHDGLRLAAVLLLGLACCLWKGHRQPDTLALAVAMLLLPLAYIAVYRYDSAALQPWYFANFVLPFSIAAAALCSVPLRLWQGVIALVLLVWAAKGIRLSLTPLFPSQAGFYAGAQYLRAHPELGQVGAWNAGVENFFSGGRVVNIDGLVNDDADRAILTARLPQYLASRHISAVIDDQLMFQDPILQERGGYPNGTLTRCGSQPQPIWQHEPIRRPGDNVILVQLNLPCLSQQAAGSH